MTSARARTQTLASTARREGAERSARKPGDLPPADSRSTLAEKGWLLMMDSRRRAGSLAVALAVLATAFASPALAAPADVTVRVEGAERTILPRTAVRTTAEPVGKDGTNTCAGTSALGALDRAT